MDPQELEQQIARFEQRLSESAPPNHKGAWEITGPAAEAYMRHPTPEGMTLLARAKLAQAARQLRIGLSPFVVQGTLNPRAHRGESLPNYHGPGTDTDLLWRARLFLNYGIIRHALGEPDATDYPDYLTEAHAAFDHLVEKGEACSEWLATAWLYYLVAIDDHDRLAHEASELAPQLQSRHPSLYWYVRHRAEGRRGWRTLFVPDSGWLGTCWLFGTRAQLNPRRDVFDYLPPHHPTS